jgi:hypothetical protein
VDVDDGFLDRRKKRNVVSESEMMCRDVKHLFLYQIPRYFLRRQFVIDRPPFLKSQLAF